jgi:hypothetical protein
VYVRARRRKKQQKSGRDKNGISTVNQIGVKGNRICGTQARQRELVH